MRKEGFQALAAIVVFYMILEWWGITCPIRYITGISCAGCGMSRAWLSLLRLNFEAAFAYHPLFWLPIPAAALVLLRNRMPKRAYCWGMGAVCALFLAVYLYRLIFTESQVVVFQPDQGLAARILFGLLGIVGQNS